MRLALEKPARCATRQIGRSLPSIRREYTYPKIAVMTRASPARLLGLSDRGHEELRVGDGGEADEESAVAQLRLEHVRGRKAEPRLAGSPGAGEGDEPGTFVAEKRAHRRQLAQPGLPDLGRHRVTRRPLSSHRLKETQ